MLALMLQICGAKLLNSQLNAIPDISEEGLDASFPNPQQPDSSRPNWRPSPFKEAAVNNSRTFQGVIQGT